MLLPPSFLIFCLAFSVGRCQFFYNYEESDAADSPQEPDESALYNSPSAVNRQFQQETRRREEAQDGPQRKNSGDSGNDSSESLEESDTPRVQRSRKRLYRRVVRDGNYVEPTWTPRTYAPSIFENIGLGQAPSGVYIPQDSFLNVLRNNQQSFRSNAPTQYYQNNAPEQYYQNNAPEPRFFVQPPSVVESRPERHPAIQPNVQYMNADNSVRASPENQNSGGEMDVRRDAQPTRPRRQRQHARPASRPEPVVDIDVLRTPSYIMRPTTAVSFQGQRASQGRSVSRNRQRQTLLIQDYPDAIQPPKTYSPSVFSSIGLGEAPQGVDIPADSLLNILRNPSANSRTSPRIVTENSQFSPQPQEQDNSHLAVPEETPSMPYDSRRPRQRSRNSNTSGRTVRRRNEYQYDDETLDSVQAAPASSHQPRSQRTRNTDSGRSRGYASGTSENQQVRRQQPTESQQSQNTDRQQSRYKPAKLAIAALPEDTDDDGIPGEAGIDHPTLHTIPRTTFSCREQLHSGYYADLETSCQVVHLCQAGGVKNSFLCPNGTIFSQEKFSCQWWYKVNCADSPKFYSINDSLYKVPEDKRQKAKE